MVWVWINVVLTVAFGGVWWLSSKGAMTLFHEWYSAPCLVDANGDGVLDPAGWSGTPDAQHRLTAVDGRTGDVLWTGDGVYPAEAQVICAGRGALIVTRPDFGVEVRDAKTGALRGTLRAPDKIDAAGRGRGCVRLYVANEEVMGVRTEDASRVSCPTKEHWYPFQGVIAGPDGWQQPAMRDGVRFQVVAHKPGTPLLTVSAWRGKERVWEHPLNLAAPTRLEGLPLIVTPQAVVTYGLRPGDADAGWLVGLDTKTGRPLYQQRQDSSWSDDLMGFAWNGRFILARWGCGLHAYDPATGERRWHIGGR